MWIVSNLVKMWEKGYEAQGSEGTSGCWIVWCIFFWLCICCMSEREGNTETQWEAAALEPVHYCHIGAWCGFSPAARLHPVRPLLWRVSNSLWESLLLNFSVETQSVSSREEAEVSIAQSMLFSIKYWWLAHMWKTFEKSIQVLTCAIGIDRSQNGSNMVERKPQAVQVRELFSWPTNRSKDRNERWRMTFNMDPNSAVLLRLWCSCNPQKCLTYDFAVLSLQVHIPHPPAFLIIPVNRRHVTLFHITGEEY